MPRLQFAPVFTTTRRRRQQIMSSMLAQLKSRAVPMICANPDRTVERGGRIIYCAGAIAAAYEALGGTVSYAGKPFRPIYELALELACALRGASVAKERVLAIGDGIATDIAGAVNFGVPRRLHRERRARGLG